ncbi:MAG TPA: biotin/lipoyl-binding protein, partial [Rhizomicrobium sp.]|nr:biotin/lipoyl-binding protein [Rhizomicrobium sp.]
MSGEGGANDKNRSEENGHKDETGEDADEPRHKKNDKKDGDDDNGNEEDDKPSIFENPWIRIGLIVLVVILLIGGLIFWLIERQYEDTDDAFIDTHIVHISPQIAGQVTAVLVNDNQRVRKGQMLVEIDSADANSKLAQVEAQKAQAQTQYQQALATEKGAAAQAENARRDLARYRLLQRTSPLAVAQQQVDQAVAAERNAVSQR